MQTINQQNETEFKAESVETPRGKNRPWWQASIEFVALSVVAVAALEGFFALAKVGQQEFLEPDKQLGCQHIPGKVVTWRLEGFSNDKLSNSGLRDVEHAIAKPAGVTRIALLGDSATEGMQVNMDQTFARVLEQRLNAKRAPGQNRIEAINFGCSSYSTGQQLLQFRRDVAQYKPDLVVLLYNRGDAIENVFTPSPMILSAPRPYFYVDKKGDVQVDENVMKAASSKLQPSPLLNFLRRNSRIYGVFTSTNMALSLNEPRYRNVAAMWARFTSQFEKNDGPSTWTVPYDKQDPVDVSEKLVTALQHDTEATGGKLVVMMFPNIFYDSDYQRQEARFEILSRKIHYSYLNLTKSFLAAPNTKEEFLEYHFSAKGHELVASQLQPVVESLLSQAEQAKKAASEEQEGNAAASTKQAIKAAATAEAAKP